MRKNHGIYLIFFTMWDFFFTMGELILYFNNDRIFPPTWDNLFHGTHGILVGF